MASSRWILPAIALAVLTIFAWLLVHEWRDQAQHPPGAAESLPSDAAPLRLLDREASTPSPTRARKLEGSSQQKTPSTDEASLGEGEVVLIGQVFDADTQLPVPSFVLGILHAAAEGFQVVTLGQRRHPDGRFRQVLPAPGSYRVIVRSAHHRRHQIDAVEMSAGSQSELRIPLDPGTQLRGRVTSALDAEPIGGATVVAAAPDASRSLVRGLFVDSTHSATTGGDGRFVLSGLEPESTALVVVHDDFGFETLTVDPMTTPDARIELQPAAHVHGRAFDEEGEPVPNVVVTMERTGWPIAWPAVTDDAGHYRLPAARPGPLTLTAKPPPSLLRPDVSFETESRTVELEARDLEIDFGREEDTVTWVGTFFGPSGEPVPGGILEFRASNGQNGPPRQVSCDELGRFEVRKLAIGQVHEVALGLPDVPMRHELGPLLFESGGRHERDVRVPLTWIRGRVVLSTGEPPPASAFVMAMGQSPPVRAVTTPLDPEGEFALWGLRPGTYDVSAHARGLPSARREVVVSENEPRDDLVIEIPLGGRLELSITGFTDADPASFDLYLERENDRRGYFGPQRSGANGRWDRGFDLAEGRWTVTSSFEPGGPVHREVTITAGQITRLTIDRSELEIGATDSVTVAGLLTDANGEPVAGVTIRLTGYQIPGEEPGSIQRTCTTDEEGSFRLPGVRRGRWAVGGSLPGGGDPKFPELVVPVDAPDPFFLELVLPSGRLRGRLVDGATRKPLRPDGPMWWAWVLDPAQGGTVIAELQGGHRGSDFELVGIPSGQDYRLRVRAQGYLDLERDSIAVAEGRATDLGALELQPAGIIDLLATSPSGEAVKDVDLVWNGRALARWERIDLDAGRARYDRLPPGQVTVIVRARGYRDEIRQLVLPAGEPVPLEVVLTAVD